MVYVRTQSPHEYSHPLNPPVLVQYGGVGHHIEAVMLYTPGKVLFWGRCALIATTTLFTLSSTLPKLVILALYLRIFVKKWSRISCYALGVILVLSCVINIVLIISRCSPPDYVWDKSIPRGHCRNDVQAQLRWGALTNIITDVAMLILPMVCFPDIFQSVLGSAIDCRTWLGSSGYGHSP